MIRQALTIAALSAVILTPVAVSAQPRGYPRGGYDRPDRGRGPPPRRDYDDRRYDQRRGGPDERDGYRDPRRGQPRCGGGGSSGIIGAIAGGLLGNGPNGRVIDRSDGRPC
ncbi:hypothetical protein [Sphingomonas quercus]|uniref:17 kDa surface antigen n=1 Tax=Sphingomonas quercus TaxID=2842451 RepID=A0ABS6BFF6_9SPHN|nr:hypothetical protein [Sphingomonas quercus]MBU3077030.1 hypothetical protein [Sphingomonas quercus]